jgi:integrase
VLLMTGARRGETRAAMWEQFDLKEGLWTKPSHATKQKKEHRVPLAAPVRLLLAERATRRDAELQQLAVELKKAAPGDRAAIEEWHGRVSRFVFPSRKGNAGHIDNLKKPWEAICKRAKIARSGPQSVRVHDLRHTAASILVSGGASLPLIGQLLGHTQVVTTSRYAHLFDDAQRAAVERLGAAIVGGKGAEVVELKSRTRKTSTHRL